MSLVENQRKTQRRALKLHLVEFNPTEKSPTPSSMDSKIVTSSECICRTFTYEGRPMLSCRHSIQRK